MTVPRTKSARHSRIVELLAREQVRSQAQLRALLVADGVEVTQATLSRDLDELGAIKVPAVGAAGQVGDAELVYAVPAEGAGPPAEWGAGEPGIGRLGRVAEELMVSVEHSGNLVVLRTPPGAAQFLASTIDQTVLPTVIGTVAGDDTVLLVTRAVDGGADVASSLLRLVESRR